MNVCVSCGNPKIENRDLGLCGSCNQVRRKTENVKLPSDPQPIGKVSHTQSKLLRMFAVLKKRALLNQWCAVHGRNCIPTDIHHVKGRSSTAYADQWAEEKGVPLLLDTRFFLPVCREAHTWIEVHPTEAKEQGYSKDRLTKGMI